LKDLRRLLAQAWPYRGRLAAACISMLGYGAASAGLAYLIKPILDEVLIQQVNLGVIATLIVLLYAVKGLFSYFATYLMSWVGQRAVMDLRNRLYRHVIRQSVSFFKRQSTGTLISHITNDVEKIQLAVSEALGDLLMQSFALVGYGALLFYYDYKLAVICLVAAPLAIHPLFTLGRKLRHITDTGLERWRDISNLLQETISGSRIVKAFRMEAFETERFEKATDRLFRSNMRITRVISILPPIMELVGGIGIAAAIWYGSRSIAAGEMTAGEFTSFVAALFMMYTPVKKLSRVNATFQQALSAASRIFVVLDTLPEIREAPDAFDIPPLRKQIELRNVQFSYPDREGPTLENVDLVIEAGQVVALVGSSGAGKTTLASLIPRFYDPTGGTVLFDGVDIRKATLSSVRGQIGLVTQEVILFNDTVRSNIAYGLKTVSGEALREAASAANALEFIESLPRGFDTVIGEKGSRLSGGERQRLAIARAILKNPPILVLDEATSSLDAESEALVQQALETLMANRTTIVIAHRLSTVRRADQIIVIDEGRIREVGRHDELIARSGSLYRRLYELQFALGVEPLAVSGEPL
jgi:subfamily B ATP-binding cassette protein MsbA